MNQLIKNMTEFIPIIIGYLLGSIPFSFIIAKLKGVDLRGKVKNGQVGAAAVKRNVGIIPAIFAGGLDFSKGALAIFLVKKISKSDWILVLTGLAAIIGHNWSIFLRFWGGKGGAVSIGEVFYLLTYPFLCSLYLLPIFLLIKKEKIFFAKKTTFFHFLGFVSISIFGFIFDYPFPISISPILFFSPIILKKN